MIRPSRRTAALFGVTGTLALSYWVLGSPNSQLLGSFPHHRAQADRVIALTFDDGPNEPYTSQIGDFLADEQIRATFFQVGACVERFPDVPAQLMRQGHVIGNHSYSHRVLRCVRPGAQRRETARAQQVLNSALGRRPALYRPPWLLRTPFLMRSLKQAGLQPISGTFCHAFEVFQPSPERIAGRALAKARPGAILIFHDGFDARGGDRRNTVAAAKMVVASLKEMGYRFVAVDDLLAVPAYRDMRGVS